jgi:hypothetical protein
MASKTHKRLAEDAMHVRWPPEGERYLARAVLASVKSDGGEQMRGQSMG